MAGMYGCFKSKNSDSGSMASGPPDVMTNQEPAEVAEECSGKKKSKFQTFKKFFTRKKRKEPPAAAAAAGAAAGTDAGLKASQSSDNVSKTSDNNTLTRSEKEKGSGSKISLGSKALSHDSVFVSDSSEANEALGASQDSIHGKVKSLQLQLKQAIKLGSPPSLMCVKRTEDAGTMSEDDGLPCSPPEYTSLHAAMNQVERNSSVSLEGLDSDDEQLSCPAPSRAMSPLVVPGDFSQPASPFGCLDNSAAKHKLGLRHKACNKRKPVARLEMKVEADSMTPNTSVIEASVEKDQQRTSTEAADEPTPKVEVEEEEKEEEEEEEESQHATRSLLRDKEPREEGEDEPEAGQDVSQGLDTSCPTEPCPSEEEVPDVQPSSSRASSGAASLDSPRNTPEPPAGQREHVLDPPAVAREEEEDAAEDDPLPTAEEDGVQEESSFLQEVLSSLKTPLAPSPSVGEAEADHLEVEEVKEGEDVGAEEEEEKEEEEEEAEMEEPEVLPADSLPSQQTTKEEEEVSAFRSTCQDEEEEEEEHKVEDKEEEAAVEEEEEEELMVEQICPLSEKEEEEKGEEEEVPTEHKNDLLPENPVVQEEGRGDEEREAEEEEAEVEKQEEEVEEAEEAAEALMDVAEDMMQHEAAAEDADVAVALQDEGDEDDAMNVPESRDDAEIPAELHSQVMKSEAVSSLSCEEQEEEEEEEERMEESEDEREHKPDREEDDGANRPDEDQTAPDVEQEAVEESHSEAAEEAPVPSKPSPLSLPESHDEAQPLEGAPITPSKTSTTTLHINLVSPSSEKATSFFQQSQNVEHPKGSETISAAEEATEQNTTSAEEEEEEEEEEAGAVEAVEEEKQLVPEEEEKEAPSPASMEEPVHQSPSGSAQSKVRFTVAPSWQRSLSAEDAKDAATPPSTPPASSISSPSSAIAGPGDEAEESEEAATSAEGEQVLVSDRVRNTKAPAAKPQRSPASPPSPVKTPTSTSTEESSVIMEGNPDNPFGVRLRKTSGLYRFSSEEENTEPHVEAAAPASSSKVDSPQPVSVKPSISPPASTKPALPKKPDVHGDVAGKSRRISEPAAGRGVSGGSDSPSWITVAKQKQKIYKENSLEEIAVKKEEQERKSSLPMYVSSAVSREHGSSKTAESTGKGSPMESSKSSVSAEKEPRRSLSPPTPVPAQTPKSQSFPSPVPPKPQPPPATSKPPPHKSMSPPTPVPVTQKPVSCTSPPPPSKPAASASAPQPQSAAVTSPPFSPRTAASEKPVLRAPGLPSQTPSSQRGGPPPALPQDEPPWMALAKKKAKAWSEMPQIAPV